MEAAGKPVPFVNHVPHYDVYGQQLHRKPYKDQGNLLKEDIRHDKWLRASPPIRTRSELEQARRRGRIPDPSYDFDGDGVVGQLDYFIGRSFDGDCDGRLTDIERGRAWEALEKGFMDRHVRVMQDSGRIQQRHGLLMEGDHINKGSLYPPHYNSDKIPDVGTKSALNVSRRAELNSAGAVLGERYAESCAKVPEPQPANAQTEPRQCSISHIRERAEADHQASRVRAGLLPTPTPVNPEREVKEVGLGRVEDPYFATRSQLRGARKELMKRQCEELRMKGEEVVVPNSVRAAEKEWRQFEFQRPQGEAMTRTKLRDQRRRDKIEYDMTHFEAPRPPEYPRYSDRPDVPFWQAGPEAKPQRAVRIASEPVLKVTDVPFTSSEEQSRSTQALAESMKSTGEMARGPVLGSQTVRRWTTDMLERGQGRNKPRLFDNIQPVRIGPLDLMPLELNSSMECIRNAARNGREEERQRSAANPLRSLLFHDTSALQLTSGGLSPGRTATKLGAGSQREQHGADGTGKVGLGGTAPLRKNNSVTISDPVLRPAVVTQVSDKPREPKFFGSMTRPASSTGVRCGGFQRFEHPASKQQQSSAQPQRARASRGEPHTSKDRTRSDPKEGTLSGAAAQTS